LIPFYQFLKKEKNTKKTTTKFSKVF